MYRFSLKIDGRFRVGLVIFSIAVLAMPVVVQKGASTVLAMVLLLFVSGFLYRVRHYGYYELGPDYLRYSLGFGEQRIPIDQIHWVKKSRYPSAGRRAALATDGLLIGYGAGYELFISPEEEEVFQAKLEELIADRGR